METVKGWDVLHYASMDCNVFSIWVLCLEGSLSSATAQGTQPSTPAPQSSSKLEREPAQGRNEHFHVHDSVKKG